MPATAPSAGFPQPDDEFGGASEPRIGTVVVTREQRSQGREEGESPDPQASISTVIQPHKAPVLQPNDARAEPHAEPAATPSPGETDETAVRVGWGPASVEQELSEEALPVDEPMGEPEPAGEQGHEAFSDGYADEPRPSWAHWDDPEETAESEPFMRDAEDETQALEVAEPELARDEASAVVDSEVAEPELARDEASAVVDSEVAEPELAQDEASAVVVPEVVAEPELARDEVPAVVVPEVVAEPELAQDEASAVVDSEVVAEPEPNDDEAPAVTDDTAGDVTHAAEVERFKARIAELEELVNRRERDLMRLETGATAAWDTTVPSLERAIEELRQENGELQAALNAVRAQVESAQLELELVQKSRGSMPRATDTY